MRIRIKPTTLRQALFLAGNGGGSFYKHLNECPTCNQPLQHPAQNNPGDIDSKVRQNLTYRDDSINNPGSGGEEKPSPMGA